MSSAIDLPTGTAPELDIERSWENPFDPKTPVGELYDEVASEERDLVIILDDYFGRRGTGKTIASLQLANGMDQTEEGLVWGKTSLQPEVVRNAYANQPMRSGLVMDEGEFGASNRNPMSKTNQALREIISMGRVEQKYLVVNTPIKSFIDKDIRKMADLWITMVRRGLGLVHEFRWEPYSETLLTPRIQWMEFEDVPTGTPLRDVYNRLTREKKKFIKGEEGDPFVPRSEYKKAVEEARKEAEKRKRNEIIQRICNNPEIVEECGVSQRMIADSIGLSPSAVGNIARGEV